MYRSFGLKIKSEDFVPILKYLLGGKLVSVETNKSDHQSEQSPLSACDPGFLGKGKNRSLSIISIKKLFIFGEDAEGWASNYSSEK